MTSVQRSKLLGYWWPDACKAQGWNPKDREKRLSVLSAAVRRQLTSANDLTTNEDIDAVKAHLLSLSRPDDLSAQLDVANQPRTRLLHAIRSFGFSRVYICEIAMDRFGLARSTDDEPWSGLPLHQLEQLRNTLSNRARAKKAKAARPPLQTVPEEDDVPF